MRVYEEIDVYEFMMGEAWSGARDTVAELTDEEAHRVADEIEAYFADNYGDVDKTTINDLLWFEDDLVATFAGFNSWEELTARHDWKDEKTIEELTAHPSAYKDELQQLRESIEEEADEDTPEDERNEAERLLWRRGWDVDEITLQDLREYYKGVHFVYDDFFCHM